MTNTNESQRAIGVFDSGVGGLTVLKAIQSALPHEHLIYLGDTARLPYGTKSPVSIERYALQATALLAARDIKMLVVACNTASAVALETLRNAFASIPVIGVVEPGARAAVATADGGVHRVLATEATVRLGAYKEAIMAEDVNATVDEQACEMLVSLAEEGWTDGDIAAAIVRRYLDDEQFPEQPDTIILGCTHFPLLANAIALAAGPGVAVVDSASTTATFVGAALSERDLLNTANEPGDLTLLATDGCTRFAHVGGRFLGQALTVDDIELVDL